MWSLIIILVLYESSSYDKINNANLHKADERTICKNELWITSTEVNTKVTNYATRLRKVIVKIRNPKI